MRLLSRGELALAKYAGSPQSYNGVTEFLAVWPDRVEVTNGHYAIIYSDKGKPPVEDFPVIKPRPEEEDAQDIQWPILISRDVALGILKSLPKKSIIPILNYAALLPLMGGGAFVYTTDLESWTTKEVRKVDQKFPDLKRVIPAGKTQRFMEGAGFSAAYLQVIGEVATLIQDRRSAIVVVPQLYGDDASLWTASAEGGSRQLTVVLMPMRA